MQSRFGFHQDQNTDRIECPKCGSVGVINWDCVPTPEGLRRDFVGINGDFYERLSTKAPHPIELVCTSCRVVVRLQSEAQPLQPSN